VGFIENENLVAIAGGRKPGSFAQVTCVIDSVVACSVDFDDVERPRTVSGQFDAAVALSARGVRRTFSTIETPSQDSRGRRLPTTARARKQIRVIRAVLAEGGAQRIRDLGLSDEFIERFRSIPTIESDCHPLRLLAPTDFLWAARADRQLRPVERDGGTERPPAHPPEPGYPCFVSDLGELAWVAPREGLRTVYALCQVVVGVILDS